jgi:hypothetical protein
LGGPESVNQHSVHQNLERRWGKWVSIMEADRGMLAWYLERRWGKWVSMMEADRGMLAW